MTRIDLCMFSSGPEHLFGHALDAATIPHGKLYLMSCINFKQWGVCGVNDHITADSDLMEQLTHDQWFM